MPQLESAFTLKSKPMLSGSKKEKNAVKRKMKLKQQLLKCRRVLGRIKRRIIR